MAAKPVTATTSSQPVKVQQSGSAVSLTFQQGPLNDNIQQPVEQQSPDFFFGPGIHPETWVNNPTGCVWDADDELERQSVGRQYLDPGVTVNDQLCMIADWAGYSYGGHHAGVHFSSNSPNIAVSITFAPGWTFTVPGVFDPVTRNYDYNGCQRAPWYIEGDLALQPILNSNGGVGVPTKVKLTITNLGSRRATASAAWHLGNPWTDPSFC
jgi:hypothetical protein